MNPLAATFLSLETFLSSSSYPQDVDLYSFSSKSADTRNLKNLRDDFVLNHSSSHETIYCAISRVQTISKLHCESAYVNKELVRQRLHSQRVRSEKRLKELVFEIFGEYAKTKIRVVRRKQFLQLDHNLKLTIEIWKLRWKRFCLKLSNDLFNSCNFKRTKDFNVVHCGLLYPELNADEMESVVSKLSKKAGLVTAKGFNIISVVKIRFLGTADTRVHLANQNILFAESVDELHTMFATIQQWLFKIANVHHGSSLIRLNSVNADVNCLLSTSVINWLHISSLNPSFWESINRRQFLKPTEGETSMDPQYLSSFAEVFAIQHMSSLFNSRVYFCLEDSFFVKYKSLIKDCAKSLENLSELLTVLRELYCIKSVDTDVISEALSDPQSLYITDMCTLHQESTKLKCSSFVRAFPDVIKARSKSGTTLHFACANALILQILYAVKDNAIDSAKDKFFVLVLNKSSSSIDENSVAKTYSNIFVYSLPIAAEVELAECYIKHRDPYDRDNANASAIRRPFSAFEILPDHARLRAVFNSAGVNSSVNSQKLYSSYFLMGDDNSFSADVDRPETQSCYYLIQVNDTDSRLRSVRSSELIDVKESNESTQFAQDNIFLHDVLSRYYCDSLRVQFNFQARGDIIDSQKVSAVVQRKLGTGKTKTAEGGSSNSQGWDVTLLSSICRWRSCLCDATKTDTNSKDLYLCLYHEELRHCLERNAKNPSGANDIAKYLPRKIPNFTFGGGVDESKKDSMTIRAASTLLQELWDGKLGQTVKSFTRRMSLNMSLKHFLESSVTIYKNSYPTLSAYNLHAISVVPTWTQWNNQDLFERTVGDQNNCVGLLNAILMLERLISDEIKDFMALNIFPTAELSIIRKEIKVFRELQDSSSQLQNGLRLNNTQSNTKISCYEDGRSIANGNAYEFLLATLNHEKSLCDKKLIILSTRKKEEAVARANAAKKAAANNSNRENTKAFS